MQIAGHGIAAVDGADRPLDLMHLFDRAGADPAALISRLASSIWRVMPHPPAAQREPSGNAANAATAHPRSRYARTRYWPYPVTSRSRWTMSSGTWQRAVNSSSAAAGSNPIDRRASGIRSGAA